MSAWAKVWTFVAVTTLIAFGAIVQGVLSKNEKHLWYLVLGAVLLLIDECFAYILVKRRDRR